MSSVATQPLQEQPLVVVSACDDNYVLGLAAALRSVIGNVPTTRQLQLFVLDGGITDRSKQRLQESWIGPNVAVSWLAPDFDALQDLDVSGHVSLSTYLRILLAELLPADISRAIYVDADTIVARNLEELWHIDLAGAPCAAVQDYFHPYLNPPEALGHPIFCQTVGFHPEPIPNYRELGLAGTAPYFNAGVMLVDVDQWRHQRTAEQCLRILRCHRDQVVYWDQYALNTVFSGRWMPIDPRWNQNTTIHNVRDYQLTHFSEVQHVVVRTDPWIIHFDYKPKPWHYDCRHPCQNQYFHWLDQTAWRGFRPRRALSEHFWAAYENVGATWRRWRSRGLYDTWRDVRRQVVSPLLRPLKLLVNPTRRKAA